MDSNLSNRQVVSRDTFADNDNVKVVLSKTSDGIDDLEEGELSDDGSPVKTPHRVVTRPVLRRDVSSARSRVKGDLVKKNPWGGVSEIWAARVLGVRVSLETDFVDCTLKIARKSVKERLGWKRREEPGPEPDWTVKMKRPRMEMVADMEERKGAAGNRLHGANLAKKNIPEDIDQQRNSLERTGKGPVSEVFQRGKEALDKKIVRSVLNDVEKQNRDDLVERDFPPLSGRFMGSHERRPRCRETLKRTVEIGDLGESDSRRRRGNGMEVAENVVRRLRKESVDSLENDNGSDLDDDSSMLIQVIQSDVESSDEESKKAREAMMKIKGGKKREETRRKKLKFIEKEESTNKLEEKKILNNRKEPETQKLKEREKIRILKQKTKEMRVREKIKALDATEKKLLIEKSRQRLKRNDKSIKSTKDRSSMIKSKTRKLGRKVDTEESESAGTETDSSSSSSSDSSDDDSSNGSSCHENVKKLEKSRSRDKKGKVQEKTGGRVKRGWRKCAASTPKRESFKVQKAKDSSEELTGKESDLKRRLKEYLKKAKEKKMV